MTSIFKKIATSIVGMTMAIGVGVGLSTNSGIRETKAAGSTVGNWTKITGNPTANDEILIVSSTADVCLAPTGDSVSTGGYSQTTFTNASNPSDGWIVGGSSSSGWTFLDSTGSTDYYLANTNNSNGLKNDTSSQTWTITEQSTAGNYRIQGTGSRQITPYSTTNWRTYAASSAADVFIYRKAVAKNLSSVSTTGQTINFFEGDKFSYGGTLTANYDNGSSSSVTPASYKFGASNIDPTSAGTSISTDSSLTVADHNGKTIYVLYTEGGITKYASYTITVNPAATVTGVSATINEGTYYAGTKLTASNFALTVTWSGGKADTHPTSGFTWTVGGDEDGDLALGSNTIVVTYESVNSSNISLTTTSYAPGTSQNPYTVAQAIAAINANEGVTNVYAKGIVCNGGSSLADGAMNYYISDNGLTTTRLEAYKGKGIGGASFTATSDIKVGDIAVIYGSLTKYNSTYEFSAGNTLISYSTLSSISVKTAPTQTSYEEDETFVPSGLVVTATYNDSSTKDFAYADTSSLFTFSPNTSTPLSTSDDSISISLFGKTTSQGITVEARTVTGVSFDGDMTYKAYVNDSDWNYTGLYLTVSYSSGDPVVVQLTSLTAGTDFSVSSAKATGATSLTISGTYSGIAFNKTITGITYASTITFEAGTDMGSSGSTGADSMYKSGITVSSTSMATTTAEYRFYGSSTLTISSRGENIRKIEFTDAGDSKNPLSNLALKDGQPGSYSDFVWLGDAASVQFSPSAQARCSKIKVITQSGIQLVTGLSVNGEAATVGQTFNINVVTGLTTQLDVAVTPDNVTETTAISYAVTSGTGATVNATTGVVTGGATVGGTATIKATSVANSNYYVYFNVTVIDIKTIYHIGFANSETGDSTELSSSNWLSTTYGESSELSIGTPSKVYIAPNSLKFGSSSAVGSLTITTPGDMAIKRVIIHAKEYDAGKGTISVNGGAAQTSTANYSYLIFDLSSASDEITIAGTTSSKGRFYIDDIMLIANSEQGAINAYGFAATFMNSLDSECSAASVSSETWTSLNSAWTTMGNSNGEQTLFLSKTPASRDSEGLTPVGDIIEKALARYDVIVAKYTSLTDFMSRRGAGANVVFGVNNNAGSVATIIVVISLVSITALGGFFFLRKRKEER